MTGELLTVTTSDAAGPVTVLAAAGEIDHETREVLSRAAKAVLHDGGALLVIDLAGVSFCDSGGLSLFVDLHRATAARDGSLRLARPQSAVLGVITATNLDRLLPVHPTVEDAVHASQPAG